MNVVFSWLGRGQKCTPPFYSPNPIVYEELLFLQHAHGFLT